ncbi:hypothetical protein [Jiangella asiatica]|uniref:Thioesterase family protein n=1 Tax=Jiangella asiatica TaxID=2530372 RepID=A0A4R5DGG3_9ACTN|nr:hypothetical protein [Jiangella asiatica]TDE10914.1 hypothetical protein E1269_10550 [Jiangella asiatica]
MTLTVPRRFRGPTTSGNGGYVAGLLAGLLAGRLAGGPVSVTLRTPPPLEAPLDVVADGAGLRLVDRETLVAEAVSADDGDLVAVDPVGPDEATAAASRYPGFATHPFPQCFVCGPEREPGDGLRLFPGRLGDGRTACVWDVTSELAGRRELVWAALDCPGGWSAPIEGRPMVLGRMTADIAGVPEPGEPCLVMGRFLETEGRKTWTASTVYGADGRQLGRAHATWIALPSS